MTQPSSSDPKNPGTRMRKILASEPREEDFTVRTRPRSPYGTGPFGPIYWTITGTISLIVNVVLIAVLLLLVPLVSKVKPVNLVGSLYNDFYRMEQAHIKADVPVRAQITVNFPLRVNVETVARISRDTTLTNVPVVINTGGVAIDAPATITLPAGSQLPILLDMVVQVQAPIALDFPLPVDIPVAATELAGPFTDLRGAIQPLYCLLNANRLFPALPQVCE